MNKREYSQNNINKRIKNTPNLCLNENDISFNKGIINNSEYQSAIITNNKKLKYNNSTTSYNNKSSKFLTKTLSFSDISNIKNEIQGLYKTSKKKKMQNVNLIKKKLEKKEKSQKFLTGDNLSENKYEKYNRENLAYGIYHDFQKINFNGENIPFLERMELYGIKKKIKDTKIEEFIKLKSPKMSENQRKKVFENIINRKNGENKNKYNYEIFNNAKKVSKKELNIIIERLHKSKKQEKIIIKEINNKDNTKKEEEDKDNNKKNDFKKKKFNSKKISEINNRLYYKEINKRDLPYKLYLEKIYEMSGNKYNDNDIGLNQNNDVDDFISFNQFIRLNSKNANKKKNNTNNNSNNTGYIFKDNDDNIVDINTENINNNNNNVLNNQLYNYSNCNMNNIKCSMIIENFFLNK
jgi:hypothetical protein